MTALDQILAHLVTSDAAARAEFPDPITVYLATGGLFNPEMADHDRVRDLLLTTRDKIAAMDAAILRMNAAVRELVEAVEAAPCETYCQKLLMTTYHEDGRVEDGPCNCWKSSALQRAAERLQPASPNRQLERWLTL